MFARITSYKMKAGTKGAATALLNDLKSEIMSLPGMKRFINVMNEDGSGYVVALVESREVSEANADRVTAIWGNFADHLEAVPTPQGFDVIADWAN